MAEYQYITLREKPELMNMAAEWFHSKWGVPTEAYLECMEAYLNKQTELGWFLCLDGKNIVGGLGVIENDFHDRKDLTPNVCAVYTEESHRGQGIAGALLSQRDFSCLSRHRPYRLLRALRLGISVHGAGRRRTGYDTDVYP